MQATLRKQDALIEPIMPFKGGENVTAGLDQVGRDQDRTPARKPSSSLTSMASRSTGALARLFSSSFRRRGTLSMRLPIPRGRRSSIQLMG